MLINFLSFQKNFHLVICLKIKMNKTKISYNKLKKANIIMIVQKKMLKRKKIKINNQIILIMVLN